MTMDTREPSRVNTVIRDDLFTSVFLPVGPLREELRLKISTRWIERLTGRPASAYLQKRGRGSCPRAWCRRRVMIRDRWLGSAQAAAMLRGLAAGSSLRPSKVSSVM